MKVIRNVLLPLVEKVGGRKLVVKARQNLYTLFCQSAGILGTSFKRQKIVVVPDVKNGWKRCTACRKKHTVF